MKFWFKKKKQKQILKQYSFVVFDKTTCRIDIYNKYYAETFDNKLFLFLGEVPNARSHCVLGDLNTGKIIGLYHTCNFREATEDEC